MVETPTAINRPSRAVAVRLREQASILLQELQGRRVQLDQLLQERGRPDAVKQLTGHSAIENAIRSTDALIREIDHSLETSRNASPTITVMPRGSDHRAVARV